MSIRSLMQDMAQNNAQKMVVPFSVYCILYTVSWSVEGIVLK